jgi:hypothetical protein
MSVTTYKIHTNKIRWKKVENYSTTYVEPNRFELARVTTN